MSSYSNEHFILQCGSSSSQSIHIQSDDRTSTCTKNDDECWNRKYELFIPKKICNHHDVGIVPLVFALHGFGGSPRSMISWEDVAEEFGFVLVRPFGYQKSWNAKYCCGEALAKTVNDVQFLKQTIDHLHLSLDFVHKDVVYGIGWSNGAFMITYAADLFRSIVPFAGYQYSIEDINFNKYYYQGFGDNSVSSSISTPGNSGSILLTGLFQHHSLDDNVVGYHGCCKDQSCCCGITADRCISAEDNFHEWGKRINQCDANSPTIHQRDDMRGVACHTMVNCHANTTLCTYDKNGHFRGAVFPMQEEVGHFLSGDTCSLSKSVWSRSEKKCNCVSNGTSNLFCLRLANDDRSLLELRKPFVKQNSDISSREFQSTRSYNNNSFDRVFLDQNKVIFVILVMVVVIYRKRSNRNIYQWKNYRRVKMDEIKNEIELSSSVL